jgi:hypothetical protein
MIGYYAARREVPATHDVNVDWVLNREFIRIHEVSRDKDVSGGTGYDAWIYIVWDAKKSEYAVMWLDNTAATNFAAEGVGHAKPDGDRIPFIFKDAVGGGIHTTLAYDRANDTWSWTIGRPSSSGLSMIAYRNLGWAIVRPWDLGIGQRPRALSIRISCRGRLQGRCHLEAKQSAGLDRIGRLRLATLRRPPT